jgi:signal transduction histidine kinase
MAGLYTLVVFGLGAMIVVSINFFFSRSIEGGSVSTDLQIRRTSSEPGAALWIDSVALTDIERLANQTALEKLRQMSLITLGVLFPASLAAGWVISGRVLRPVEQIADVARDIQASDLSRRIHLQGPDDELKHLADTFDAMLDRIEQGVDDQRRFIQDISHELRNPLATMATNLDVALSDPAADEASLRKVARLVRSTVDRTSRTVEGLMRFARRELPTSSVRPVELSGLARDVIDELQGPADRRRITLRQAGGRGPMVLADREELRSALVNLLSNAVRVAPGGSTIVVGSGRSNGWAWIGVDDEGPGIEAEEHSRIFQRNWRSENGDPGESPASGAGIGLSIVRQVAESSGGCVTLTSEPGVGSSFVIWLPIGGAGSLPSSDGVHPIHDPLRDLAAADRS